MQDVSGMYFRKADSDGQKDLPAAGTDGMDTLLFDFLDKKEHKNKGAEEDRKDAKRGDDSDAPLFPFLVTKDNKQDARKFVAEQLKTVKKIDHTNDGMEDKVHLLESIENMHAQKDIMEPIAPAAPAPEAIQSPAGPAIQAAKGIESPSASDTGSKEMVLPAAEVPQVINPPPEAPEGKTKPIVNSSQVADLHTVTEDFDMNQVVTPYEQDIGRYYVNSSSQVFLHVSDMDGCVANAEMFLGKAKPVTEQKAKELGMSSCKTKAGRNKGACEEYERLFDLAFKAQFNKKRLYTALSYCVIFENYKKNIAENSAAKGAPVVCSFILTFAQVLGIILLLVAACAMKFTSFVLPIVASNIPKCLFRIDAA